MIRMALLLPLAALPQLCLFVAQAALIAQGETETILALARYCGIIGLVLFAVDGQSGLVSGMLRLRHDEASIRAGLLLYRACVVGILALLSLGLWLLAPQETNALLPFLAGAILLRSPFNDGDLDVKGLQPLALFLQNCWMIPPAIVAALTGTIDPAAVGHATLWTSVLYAICHWRLAPLPPPVCSTPPWPAFREIVQIMAAQGLGQLYGRFLLFALGAWFTGTLPALIIFAKQAFNASALIITLLRRIELRRPIATMRLSLAGQAAAGALASACLALSALRLEGSLAAFALLACWQLLEKLSATAIYSAQRDSCHKAAFAGLMTVITLGSSGLFLSRASQSPLSFVLCEMLAYAIVLAHAAHRLRLSHSWTVTP